MTATESTTRVVSDSGNDVGPGQRLREARQAAQLTLNEVASRMRLEPHVLELLENDRYEQLHGPTFVRGYLSGYARLLDLPERPILEAYERHDHRPPALVSELGRKPEVHVSDFPVRMVTYVIAGLLVVLVVLWWQSRQPHPTAPERAEGTPPVAPSSSPPETRPEPAPAAEAVMPAEPAPATPTTTVTAAEPLPSAVQTEAEDATSPSPLVSSAVPTAPAAATASADANPVNDAPSASDEPATSALQATPSEAPSPPTSDTTAVTNAGSDVNVAANADTAPPADGSGDANAAAGSDAQQPEPAPRPAPLPGSDRLAIQFDRESWVEIYDRGGGRLYYSLASEGSEVVVEGAGPMRVLLGDIEGAAVAYNGEPLDLSRYQGRSVVRFTVGERSSTTATEPPAPAPAPAEEPLTGEIPAPAATGQEQSVADAGGTLNPSPAVVEALPASTPVAISAEPPASAPAFAQPDS
jgi:cytoskeleton protein RodZ